jgi:large subunit ribosomal protein L2
MTLRKTRKPTSPSQRHLYLIDRRGLSKKKPLSSQTKGFSKKGGRNNRGRITVGQRGGGHKKKYRTLSFKGTFLKEAKVLSIEHDPNRSAWVARLEGSSPKKDSYFLAPEGLKIGDKISSGSSHWVAPIRVGNSNLLKNIPLGLTLYNIETQKWRGGQVARSAGSSGLLLHKGKRYARIRFPSGLQPLISLKCRATIGSVSNKDYKNQVLGKAGRSRWLGKRPHVRGVAMNPIDHPHGGGEGKSSGGRPSVTPWGRPTKGQPTRSKKRRRSFFI